MPDYKTWDPKGWCGDPSRGAALGRPTIIDEAATYVGNLSVRRVRINSDGYDSNGTYFGAGSPLYWCANDAGTIDFMVRALSREDAVRQAIKQYPKAKIRGKQK